jgi:hypothetical protein
MKKSFRYGRSAIAAVTIALTRAAEWSGFIRSSELDRRNGALIPNGLDVENQAADEF